MSRVENHEVAVVGLGPTGAFTARAAYDAGYKVTIYVHGNPSSTPPGAFWLHWIPEDVSGDYSSQSIRVIGKGKGETYTRLQWGSSWYKGLTSSFPDGVVVEEGYNPSEVLPNLVPDAVKVEMIPYPFSDRDIVDLTNAYEWVFQTFPRKIDTDLQPPRIPFIAAAQFQSVDPTHNVVVYNGTGQGIVVREAYLFGNRFLEFPKHLPLTEVKRKYDLANFQHTTLWDLDPRTTPVQADLNGRVVLMGRYAQWDRRCLSHDCYSRTIQILTGDGHNG